MTDPPSDNRDWVAAALDRYERRLLGYARHLVGDAETARDVVQETFHRLCRQRRRDVEPRLAAWLFTVCRNRALDLKRKEKPMQPPPEQTMDHHAAERADPAEGAERREQTSLALRALTELPDRQQELVRLKFQQGLSYKQMAEVTGLSVSNVGYLLHTAMKTLRRQLRHEEDGT